MGEEKPGWIVCITAFGNMHAKTGLMAAKSGFKHQGRKERIIERMKATLKMVLVRVDLFLHKDSFGELPWRLRIWAILVY